MVGVQSLPSADRDGQAFIALGWRTKMPISQMRLYRCGPQIVMTEWSCHQKVKQQLFSFLECGNYTWNVFKFITTVPQCVTSIGTSSIDGLLRDNGWVLKRFSSTPEDILSCLFFTAESHRSFCEFALVCFSQCFLITKILLGDQSLPQA